MANPDSQHGPAAAERLFAEALALPPAGRTAFLAAQCGSDPALRRELESLLQHHDAPSGLLDASPAPIALDALLDRSELSLSSSREDLTGRDIDGYALVERLGEGGMGAVYLAVQRSPVKREVAMKLLRAGLGTTEILARFDAERQALALMDHPNIARIYDAAATPDGRPYFTMEVVHGLPITQHCDHYRVSVRDRLRLFAEACRGVQHAHQKGIIHRDLKPSNILVALQSGEAVPKVIDFGVSKVLGPAGTVSRELTRHGLVIGTPDYMSPEQEANGLQTDTRSDVYSLGVILHELLVGVLPHRPSRDETPATTPTIPSRRVQELGDRAEEVCAQRTTTLSGLARTLSSDLDWIVSKALEVDPSRRYVSVQDLAGDVDRYLSGEPVTAGPPTFRYRFSKRFRRHRLAFAFAALAILSLLVGAAFSVRFAMHAREAERRALAAADEATTQAASAAALLDFMRLTLFQGSPNTGGTDVSVRTALDAAAAAIDETDAISPSHRVDVHRFVGEIYASLGDFAPAEEQLRASIDGARAAGDPDQLAAAAYQLAPLLLRTGRFEEGVDLYHDVLDHYQATRGPEDPVTLGLYTRLALAYDSRCQYAKAESLYRAALPLQRRVLGAESCEFALAELSFGTSLAMSAAYDDAESLMQDALRISRESANATDAHLWQCLYALGFLYRLQEDWTRSFETLSEARDIGTRIYDPSHYRRLRTDRDYAAALTGLRRADEAIPILVETRDTQRHALGNDSRELALTHLFLGDARRAAGQLDLADHDYREALRVARVTKPDEDDAVISAIHDHWGRLAAFVGDVDTARRHLEAAYEQRRRLFGDDHPNTSRSLASLRSLESDARDGSAAAAIGGS